MKLFKIGFPLLIALIFLTVTTGINAHCDTMNGPVIKDAKAALSKGDVTLVLKWVKKENEEEVKNAFKKTLEVRKGNATAREIADMYFFETLVRLHRSGEGEPYTGLKPENIPVDPLVKISVQSIETGNNAELLNHLQHAIKTSLADKFNRVIETAKKADSSVEAGREYVEAYVNYLHFAEKLHEAIKTQHGEKESHL